jgi:nucleoside-diphosphate-sugar epimerase
MILVTGGTGFIGGHLVERLVAQGRPVRCLVRRSSAVGDLPLSAVDLAYGDLAGGQGLLEALRGVDTVIHLAGVTKARTASDYYAGNAAATANLLRVSGGVRRFVHVSSLAAAGPSMHDTPLTEDAPPDPVSHYGRSKLAGEEAVRKSPVWERTVIVRPPVVYGPCDRDVYQVIRAVARGWMVRIGSAERRFSLIYVGDVVEGLIAAADRADAGGKIFYLAHPSPVSWEKFGATAARLMGRSARTVTIPEPAAYALGVLAEWWARLSGKPGILSRDKVTEACCAGWVCDPRRAWRELGFRASTALDEGLGRTLDWYKEAGWLTF